MISLAISYVASALLLAAVTRADGASAFVVGVSRTGTGGSPSPSPSMASRTRRPDFSSQSLCRRASTGSRERALRTRLHSSPGSGFGDKGPKIKKKRSSSSPSSPSSQYELFELQELRAQLQTMLDKNILYQTVSDEKRDELAEYVKAVVEKTDSPIDFSGKKGGNAMGTAQFVAGVEGKSWRMVFSTDGGGGGESGGGGELPYGSTVILRIREFMGSEGSLDYVLKFSKQVMGLNELVAKSTCSVDIGPVNPGLFSFQYEDIKTNIFGVSNLPVGFFGLLKGRATYIDTVWFDGERWIERNYLENGDVVYSVYVRDTEDENQNKR